MLALQRCLLCSWPGVLAKVRFDATHVFFRTNILAKVKRGE